MTCPRCGAPLPVGAPVCARCGLPRGVDPRAPATGPYGYGPPPGAWSNGPPAWGPYGYPPPPGFVPRPPRPPLREGVVRVARLASGLAALACLAHGVVSMTLRRATYVGLSEGRGGSQSSDLLNVVLLTVASLTSLLALVLALVVLGRGRGWSAASGTGFALAGVGWLVVLVGAALVAGADTRAEAGTAAFAAVLVGIGFVAVAIGHALLAFGLSAPERDGSLATAPYPGPDPYAGTPLARDPADRPVPGAAQARPGDA